MSCSTRDNVTAGSSPHTRGARAGSGGVRPDPGIIPAYAGSTSAAAPGEDGAPDHPRIRGEHQKDRSDYEKTHGSSPHTRGAPVVLPVRGPAIGIIPAYAGSTRPSLLWHLSAPDHPRIRGEHGRRAAPTPARRGSSPHTRGARSSSTSPSPGSRIIPAYAGSTATWAGDVLALAGSSPHTRGAPRSCPARPVRYRDHPRIRGEHSVNATSTAPTPRIIPAYAGSTAWPSLISRSPTGSSPHTRGARLGGARRH